MVRKNKIATSQEAGQEEVWNVAGWNRIRSQTQMVVNDSLEISGGIKSNSFKVFLDSIELAEQFSIFSLSTISEISVSREQ